MAVFHWKDIVDKRIVVLTKKVKELKALVYKKALRLQICGGKGSALDGNDHLDRLILFQPEISAR